MIPSPLLPALRGESGLEEWEDLLIKYLRAKKLDHTIKEPRKASGPTSSAKSHIGTDDKKPGAMEVVIASKSGGNKPERNGSKPDSGNNVEKIESIPAISLEFLDDILGSESGGDAYPSTAANTQGTSKKADNETLKVADWGTSIKAARDDELERAQVLLLLAASVSSVRDWLLNQGWDAGETDPARYFRSIKDCFSRNASVNSDLEINELKLINSASFDTIRAFQERLRYLRRRMFMTEYLSG